MNYTDKNIAKNLELTGIIKYWRGTGKVEIELDWLYD